jgi:hypothetical protein
MNNCFSGLAISFTMLGQSMAAMAREIQEKRAFNN